MLTLRAAYHQVKGNSAYLGGRDGTRTRNLLLAKQLRSQLRHKPINIHLENLIKSIVGFYPLLIQYYPLFSHSDDKSEPQSRRSETSYRSSGEPKNPSTERTLFPSNFHPPFRRI